MKFVYMRCFWLAECWFWTWCLVLRHPTAEWKFYLNVAALLLSLVFLLLEWMNPNRKRVSGLEHYCHIALNTFIFFAPISVWRSMHASSR